MRRAFVLLVLMTIGGLSMAAYQGAPAKRVRDIQNVRDNLYFITGGDTYEVGRGRPTWTGGNVAVFVTNNGVVLIDSMLAGSGPGLLAQVKKVTDKPVTMIINTHTHSDHTGSDPEFPATVEIVAHENTKALLSQATCAPVTNCNAFKGTNEQFLPKRVFKDKLSLGSGRDQIDLYYFGRGHTSGDAWVVFPALRAMHTGDMFQRRNMPSIDIANSNGSATEFAPTLNKALNQISNVDTVIGGHTPTVMTWLDFKDYVDFYNDFVTFVQNEKKTGKGVDQVVSAYRIPIRYNGYYADPSRVKQNVQAIFENK
jgi:cyclase